MNEVHPSAYVRGATRSEGGQRGRLCAGDWLGFAAAPVFAIMAVATGLGSQDICSTVHSASPLSGMVPMYVLMSAFHLSPWLKLISSGRSSPR
jgi:hypothetical protein